MKIRTEIRVGLISIIAITIFIWGYHFMKGQNILKSQKTYYIIYPQINGLEKENPVMINGFRVGQVNSIDFLPDGSGKLMVTITLEKDFNLPKNTVAQIFSADLMGTQAIRLQIGNASELAQTRDTLTGSVEGSLSEQVSAQVLPIKNKAEKLLGSIDSVMAVIQYTFNEDFRKNFSRSLTDISTTLHSLKRASYTIDTTLTNEDGTFANFMFNLEQVSSSLKNNLTKIDTIIANISEVTDSLSQAHLKTLVNNLASSLSETQTLLSNINQGKGTIGQMAVDDSLYMNLKALTLDLDLLMKDLKANPSNYVHFSVFGGNKSKKSDRKK